MNTRNILIALGVILILGGAGFFAWSMFGGGAEEPVVVAPLPPPPTENTFSSSTLGVSIKYPKEYIFNSAYAYDAFGQKKLIQGVKFSIPATMATGTNLAADSGVSLEWLPNARNCTGDIYLKANVKPLRITEGTTEYSLATSSTKVGGGTNEEWVYALVGSKPCTAVRYFIHTTADTSTPQQFDRASLLFQFDKIRKSLVVSR